MTYNVTFFYLTVAFFALALCLFTISLFRKNKDFLAYHRQWVIVCIVAATFSLILRYRESGYFPLVTLYEITFFYAFFINILYVLTLKKETPVVIQGIVLSLTSSILVSNVFMDKNIYPLNPLLDSNWLIIHVPTAMLSYSAFAISFAISVYYIIAEKANLPKGEIVKLNMWLISVGALLLGVCIVTGSVWAKSAWGNYWSWDPKETWALVTFLIYGSIFVFSKVLKIKPKWYAYLSILGFLAMLFTFFGVGFLMQSHHAYQ